MSDITKTADADEARRGSVGNSGRGHTSARPPSRRADSVLSGPSRATADPLSETGVLRLLNECPAPEQPSERLASRPPVRENGSAFAAAPSSSTVGGANACPRCGHHLAAEIAICPRCRTRLATSSKVWQAVYRAASRALAAR